ncbi:MAG: PH domain-containing protein [Bryobacteraceae bacterium]|nr:PH domain-containing protein [Bryobacteraceae bacterium]MDW8379594.1 PH domain-containing protein [Bryobacterales bacterium]
MAALKIRPSTKLVTINYAFALLLTAGIAWLGWSSSFRTNWWMLAFAVPALLIVLAASRHLRAVFTTLELVGDRLKFESGMLAKTSRSVPLSKVQDVTVSQTFGQRLLGIGDLTIETAGETGRLHMPEINSPREVAEKILDRVAEQNPNRKIS